MTTHRIRLPFERPPLTLNQQRSHNHWSVARQAKRDVEQAVWALARQQQIPPLERCVAALVWHVGDKRRRDVDALGWMGKGCLDGLVKAGVLADDNAAHVAALLLAVRVDGSKPAWIELALTAATTDAFGHLLEVS